MANNDRRQHGMFEQKHNTHVYSNQGIKEHFVSGPIQILYIALAHYLVCLFGQPTVSQVAT